MIEDNEAKLVEKALAFATDKHRGQVRKNAAASPYIIHPISLVSILSNEAGITDMNVLCGALLHDTVEDTKTTADDLVFEFGQEISDMVMEVTDDKTLDKETRKQLQIEHAAHLSDSAKLVKLADKISNLRDMANDPPAEWSLERKQKYFDWAKEVIDQLRGVHSGLEALFDQAYSMRPNEV